jgi:hypothetical protein
MRSLGGDAQGRNRARSPLAKPKTFPLELSFGARNLLDADVRYPSSSVAFREHFPGRGLEIWTSVTFTFR